MITDPATVKFSDSYFEIEGVRISYAVLGSLMHPAEDRLYSFRREDNQIIVTSYSKPEEAAKFFKK